MAIASFAPSKNYAGFSSVVFPKNTVNTLTASSGVSTTPTLTTAQILGGLFVVTCNDASTGTLPTAALLNAAINGVTVGTTFDLYIRNIGDDTLTIAAGTGGTLASGNTNTVVTVNTKMFRFVITGVKNPTDPATSDTYTVYSMGTMVH